MLPLDELTLYRPPLFSIVTRRPLLLRAIAGSTLVTAARVALNSGSGP